MSAIKIITTPPGEAPQHIREAWVGLTLPLALPYRRKARIIGGVLSGPRKIYSYLFRRLLGHERREVGYVVDVLTAVAFLEREHPEAAAWWRQNTPHLLAPGRRFIFSANACEETETVVWPPPPVP